MEVIAGSIREVGVRPHPNTLASASNRSKHESRITNVVRGVGGNVVLLLLLLWVLLVCVLLVLFVVCVCVCVVGVVGIVCGVCCGVVGGVGGSDD